VRNVAETGRPSIYVAGTGQHSGKALVSLGLVAKVLPDDLEKIETGKRLVAENVDLQALLDAALDRTGAS